MKIYLAHSLGSREHIAQTIQPIMTPYCDVINPFEHEMTQLESLSDEQIRKKIISPNFTIHQDEYRLKHCDAMVAYFTKGPSFGASFELAFAHYQLQIPILIIVQERYLQHPWLRSFATLLCGFETFEATFHQFLEVFK